MACDWSALTCTVPPKSSEEPLSRKNASNELLELMRCLQRMEQHLSGLSSFSRRASTNFTSKDMCKGSADTILQDRARPPCLLSSAMTRLWRSSTGAQLFSGRAEASTFTSTLHATRSVSAAPWALQFNKPRATRRLPPARNAWSIIEPSPVKVVLPGKLGASASFTSKAQA